MNTPETRHDHPAADTRATEHTDWGKGRTTYTLPGFGSIVITPVGRCTWHKCPDTTDAHGRHRTCHHVAIQFGAGGPYTRPENRTDPPIINNSPVLGTVEAATDGTHLTSHLIAERRDIVAWAARSHEETHQVWRAVASLVARWLARPDLHLVKAAHARAQAPSRNLAVSRALWRAERDLRAAATFCREAVADLHRHQALTQAEDLAEAVRILADDAPVMSEYVVVGMESARGDEFLHAATLDVLGEAVDGGDIEGGWCGYTATSPREAIAKVRAGEAD